MRILIIGGTRFLGRALSNEILSRGHHLTLFNRGQTNPDLFPHVERITGDRDGDLKKLSDQKWDAVIDTCGYFPRIVRASAESLKDKVRYYVFISSISVYTETPVPNKDETAEVIKLEDESVEEITGETYGGLKALCENAVEEVFPDGAIIIRPGLIIGPHDPTHRFTYWPVRIRKGGEVLAPGDGSYPVQVIDVRDLAKFTIHLIENSFTGQYNATGPEYPLTLAQFLESCIHVSKTKTGLLWIDEEWLLTKEVKPWSEITCWAPGDNGKATMQSNINRGVTHGMIFRPLEETILDTLSWYDSINGDEIEWPSGLDTEREKQLLAEYKSED